MWSYEVDDIVEVVLSQVLILIDDQVAWWRMMEELHAMDNDQR